MSMEFEHFIGLNTECSVIYHPDGQNYLFSGGGNVIVGSLTDPHAQYFLRAHDDTITAMNLSKSGSLLASGQQGSNADVIVWDLTTRSVLFRLEEHDHKIQCTSFSDDEKLLVSIGSAVDGKLIVWDMSNGYIVASGAKLPQGTMCIAHGGFLKDIKKRETQNYFFCTGDSGGIMMWVLNPYEGVLESVKFTSEGRGVVRQVTAVAFSDDRDTVYGATKSGDYIIGSVRNQRIFQIVNATSMAVESLLVSDSGLVLGCGDASVKYFNQDNRLVSQTKLDGSVLSLSFSPDRLEVLASTSNGSISRVNIKSAQFLTISESHSHEVVAVVFSQSSNDRFATASLDGTIRVWDVVEYMVLAYAQRRREQEAGAQPLCLSFSDVLLSGWSDGRILAHSTETCANLWFIDHAHIGAVTSLVLSHNKRFLLTGGSAGEIRLWELRTRNLVSHMKEHTGKVTSLALSDDDTVAFSSSRDRSILRWELKAEKRAFGHTQRIGGINAIIISKEYDCIVSVGQDRKIAFWGLSTPEPLLSRSLDGENDEGRCIARSNSGDLIVTGGSAGVLRVWDYQTRALVASLPGHSSTIFGASFSPDDKQVVSVGQDRSIHIWNVY